MTQNEHVHAICCRLEVDVDVIFCRNVRTVEVYEALNVEVASSSNFREFPIATVKSVTAAVA